MNTLIFITSWFPYEPGEAFIESEFPFLISAFEKIIIITRNVRGVRIRPVPKDVKVYRYNPTSAWYEYPIIPVIVLRNLKRVITLIKEEIQFRDDIQRHINFRQKLLLLKAIIKSLQFRDFIENVLKTERPVGEIIIYSYWMNIGARAICMLNKIDGIRIARAHRIDLYEEATDDKYIPLLKHSFLNLDAILFISEHGKRYFESFPGMNHVKNQISRLGINNPYPFNPGKSDPEVFRIVSCSSLIKVKRVHLLISALEKVKSTKRLVWYHFGEGYLKEELHSLAKEKLGKLEYYFMGHVSNTELMEFYYKNNVDLFINTSASEGIPVSIMEAQSFGIPVVATDAGGTGEIIKKDTGILLPVEFEITDLTCWIEYHINMNPEDRIELRKAIYNNWKTDFNASINFEGFISKVNSVLVSRKNNKAD